MKAFKFLSRQCVSRVRLFAAFMLAIASLVPGRAVLAADTEPATTARIVLGAHDGAAHPAVRGHGYTGGGNIDIAQPAADTLVITMTGTVAACASPLNSSEATLDFQQGVQFGVEFSPPSATGRLIVQAKLNGLLRAKGKCSVAGMTHATTTLGSCQSEIAVLPLAARMVSCGDAVALTASHGPVVVPIGAGQFNLSQHFQVTTSAARGLKCARSSAEFSTAALPENWSISPDPFHGANKDDLGYQVMIQVIPDSPPDAADATATPWNRTLSMVVPSTSLPTVGRLPDPHAAN